LASTSNTVEADDDAENEASSRDNSANVEIIQIGSNSEIPEDDPLDGQCCQIDQEDSSEPFIKGLEDFDDVLRQADLLICRNLSDMVKLTVDDICCMIEDELIENRANCGVEEGET